MEGIFKAYFEEARNIGSVKVLADIAEEAGMPEDVTRSYLESDEDVDATFKEAKNLAATYRCSGVPFFIVNSKYVWLSLQILSLHIFYMKILSIFRRPTLQEGLNFDN